MRKALVLMMATCILFAGCLEGAIEEIEDIIEEITPECDDSNALNYDENATNSKACISEEMLMDSIDVFAESMDSEDTMGGFVMTMSGDMGDMDMDMDMDGLLTIVMTTAFSEYTMYRGTDVKMNGMSVYSNHMTAESVEDGTATLLQASTAEGSFLMSSAMSWEDFLIDWEGMVSDDDMLDDEDDMDMGIDDLDMDEMMDDMASLFDGIDEDCDGFPDEDCGLPEGTTLEMQDDIMEWTVSVPTDDNETMDMWFDCSIDADAEFICTMSSFTITDAEDGSEVEFELLYPDEVAELLTIDMTLDYEALPFTVEAFVMEMFVCANGEEIPADWENDGEEDCADGSDEYQESLFVCDNGQEIPADWVNDGMDDCGDGSDEYDNGDDVFVCDSGEEIPAHWENDGEEDCADGSDENYEDDLADVMEMIDSDNNSALSLQEMLNFVNQEEGENMSQEDEDEFSGWFNNSDENGDGVLNFEEFEAFVYLAEESGSDDDDVFVCENGEEIPAHWENDGEEDCADGSDENDTNDTFVCDNGQEIPADWENDGMDDCGDGSDEMSNAEEPELIWEIFVESEFGFEGAFDDYSIVISSCNEEADDMGNTALTCGEDLMSVSLVDAIANVDNAPEDQELEDYSGIVFSDEDESGTISDGDLIGIGGNTSLDWNQVRLHSTSADAYSDENPLQQLPGFTAVLGALSLMGAAMIGRRD
jgi:hypothetical protein